MRAQYLYILAGEKNAELYFYEQTKQGTWSLNFSCLGQIGKNGIGKEREGDLKTPRGFFSPLFAFGIADNPGTQLPYKKVNASLYWVDDSRSKYYNRMVSVKEIEKDWKHAEDLIKEWDSYQYAIVLDYNHRCVPEAGSAIFIHCLPTKGAGCIAIEEAFMKKLLKRANTSMIIAIFESNLCYN